MDPVVSAAARIDDTNRDALPLAMPGEDPLERGLSLDGRVNLRLARSETLTQTARVLYHLLTEGYSVWTDGTLLFARALVGRIGHLRIEIRFSEHAPPHFHVIAGDVNASFAIRDCAHLAGAISGRERQLVERWYTGGARSVLIRTWNATRPSDCPVGPITEES